jgi:phage terminase large subunit
MITTLEQACLSVEPPKQELLGPSSFWRLDDPVIEVTEDQQYIMRAGGMWEPQRNFWNMKAFIKGFVAGYGAGKTLTGAKRIISLALQNAPVAVAAVGPTFPMTRHTIVSTIMSLLNGKQTIYGPRQFHYTYNRTLHEFKIWFKGREASIIVYSGEDPDALKGPNLAAVWLDEPFLMDINVFKQMIARVRHPQATHKEILLTGTPENLDWGYSLFMNKTIDDDSPQKLDVEFIVASTSSNKALDPSYVDRLKQALSEKEAEVYIEGKFINLSMGMVYYAFDPFESVKDMDAPNGAEWGVGMDFNVNPMSAVVFWRVNNHMHVVEEITLVNADTEFMCSTIRDKYPQRSSANTYLVNTVYPDATGAARKTSTPQGKTDFWFIRNAGFEINADFDNPKRRDRYNAVNAKLKASNGVRTLTISPNCKKLIKYLSVYSYESMNKQEEMAHLLDAFGYPVARLFPADKSALVSGIHSISGY